jgi:hypothetical protein
MGSNYKKIEYETMGAWGSTEKGFLYIKSNRSSDYVAVYDHFGEQLFIYDQWGNFDMGNALVVALSNWNDERMLDCTAEDIQKLK